MWFGTLRTRDTQLVADGSRRRLFDFAMSWDRRAPSTGRVAVNGMAAALAVEITTVPFEVPN